MKNYYIESQNKYYYDLGMNLHLQRVPAMSVATNDHIHEAIEFLYVKRGSYRAFVNDSEYVIRQGDMLLIRSNAVHRVYSMDEAVNEYYVLKFKLSFIFELALEENAADYVMRFVLDKGGAKTLWRAGEDESDVFAAFDRLAEVYEGESSCKDMALKLGAAELVMWTLRSIMAGEAPDAMPFGSNRNLTSQIYKTIKHINRHYSEDIDAEQCARDAGMSYSYFSRSFKSITGRNFKEYLNYVRVSHAEHLLYSGDRDITEIAMECGYNSVSYFISVYKRIRGKTPLQIRKEGHSAENA